MAAFCEVEEAATHFGASVSTKSEELFLAFLSAPNTQRWLCALSDDDDNNGDDERSLSAPASQRLRTAESDDSDGDVRMRESAAVIVASPSQPLLTPATRLGRRAIVAILRRECGLPRAAASLVYTRLSDTPDADTSEARLREAFAPLWGHASRDAAMWATLVAARSPRRRAGSGDASVLLPEDLRALVLDVVSRHPAFRSLRTTAGTQLPRYCDMVVARIVRSSGAACGSGRVTKRGLARTPLLRALDEMDTAPTTTAAVSHELFAPEDFFVAYNAFWQLDEDDDGLLGPADLCRYHSTGLGKLSQFAALRVAGLHPIPLSLQPRLRRPASASASAAVASSIAATAAVGSANMLMTFSDFVFFLMSVEDPSHADSLAFWFSCIDTDADGYLSAYELEGFYSNISAVLEQDGICCPPFAHVAGELLDMVEPRDRLRVSLLDIRKSGFGRAFFGTLVSPVVFSSSNVASSRVVPPAALGVNGAAPQAVTPDWTSFVEHESASCCETMVTAQM